MCFLRELGGRPPKRAKRVKNKQQYIGSPTWLESKETQPHLHVTVTSSHVTSISLGFSLDTYK